MDNKIYKEAILDAKALRAGAIANAKSIMQEALEPAIQEMMRLKLSEELEEDLEEGTYEEGYEEEGAMKEEGIDEVTDATLEEILAELDELDGQEEGAINEAEGDDEDEADSDDEVADEEEAVSDDTKVVQLTLGDLKAALMPQAAEMGDEAGEGSEEAPLSLDEILAEMEAEKYEEGKEPVEELLQSQGASQAFGEVILGLARKVGIPVEGIDATTIGTAVGSVAGAAGLITSAVVAGNWAKIKTIISSAIKKIKPKDAVAEEKDVEKVEEELETAKETIAELRESINEINLLNAKLLYMNKIFKASFYDSIHPNTEMWFVDCT